MPVMDVAVHNQFTSRAETNDAISCNLNVISTATLPDFCEFAYHVEEL